MPELPSGRVAFLFADLESAADRWDSDYQRTSAHVDDMVATLQEIAARHRGAVFKVVGESAQAAFPTVEDATTAAVTTQQVFISKWALNDVPRLAVHVGEATPRDNDYLAPALNRLARLTAAGHAGQILLTAAAAQQLGSPPPDVDLIDLGRHRLRDLLEAETVFQVAAAGLPRDFPPLRSLDGSPHNLPIQATRLIGRDADLTRIRDALLGGDRLITLVGPGGVGKTRLALQAGADELDRFPDGVWWVPLAAITDPGLVLEAIASAMPLRLPPDVPLAEALPTQLRTRRDLLILDNLEQVTRAAPQIGQLIADSPQTVVLATSRVPLGLPAETEIVIDPLHIPGDHEAAPVAQAEEAPAIQLFVERAQAVRADFQLTPDNLQDVVAICRRLDGLPLAIELAAARTRVLAPAALLSRLDRSLSVLTGGARDLPSRQQTLRAAIQWSYDLLSPAEQTAFMQLSVMAPGFSTDAARRILVPQEPGKTTEDTLESLLDQSLLRRVDAAGGSARWSMLATIHGFAHDLLKAMPDRTRLELAQAHTYLGLIEESDWFGVASSPDLAATFEADHDNFRQALTTLLAAGPPESDNLLRLATMLSDFWWIRGHVTEGRRWLSEAVATAGATRSLNLGRALAAAGLLAEAQSDLPAARRYQQEALEIFRAEGHASGVADALTGLAVIARAEGDLTRARLLHQEAHDVWTALGDEQGAAGSLLDIGVLSYLRGDVSNAEPVLMAALQAFEEAEDLAGIGYARQSLAIVSAMKGDFAQAISGFQESLRIWQQTGNEHMAGLDRTNLAEALLLNGRIVEAEALLLDTISDLEETDDPGRKGKALGILGRIRFAMGEVSAAEPILTDALRLAWSVRDISGCAEILDALAEVCASTGETRRAVSFVTASNALRAESGIERLPAYAVRLAEVVAESALATESERQPPETVVESQVHRGLRR